MWTQLDLVILLIMYQYHLYMKITYDFCYIMNGDWNWIKKID
jgi:hypothetical protein